MASHRIQHTRQACNAVCPCIGHGGWVPGSCQSHMVFGAIKLRSRLGRNSTLEVHADLIPHPKSSSPQCGHTDLIAHPKSSSPQCGHTDLIAPLAKELFPTVWPHRPNRSTKELFPTVWPHRPNRSPKELFPPVWPHRPNRSPKELSPTVWPPPLDLIAHPKSSPRPNPSPKALLDLIAHPTPFWT